MPATTTGGSSRFGFGFPGFGYVNGMEAFLRVASTASGEQVEDDEVWAARAELIGVVAQLTLTEPGASLEYTITAAGVTAANPFLDGLPATTLTKAEQKIALVEQNLEAVTYTGTTPDASAIYGENAVRLETALGIQFVSGTNFETITAFNDVLRRGEVLERFENLNCKSLNVRELLCYEDAYWLTDGVFGPIPTISRYGFSGDRLVFTEAFYPYFGEFPPTVIDP